MYSLSFFVLVVKFCSNFGGRKDDESWILGIGVEYCFKKPRGWQEGGNAVESWGSICGGVSQSFDFCLVEAGNDGRVWGHYNVDVGKERGVINDDRRSYASVSDETCEPVDWFKDCPSQVLEAVDDDDLVVGVYSQHCRACVIGEQQELGIIRCGFGPRHEIHCHILVALFIAWAIDEVSVPVLGCHDFYFHCRRVGLCRR
jgi:hypothetical protein